jgi:hypothetical protein
MKKTIYAFSFFSLLIIGTPVTAQEVNFKEEKDGKKLSLILSNPKISYTLIIKDSEIQSDILATQKVWSKEFDNSTVEIETNADFGLNLMYTAWRAPGKLNNAENPVLLNKTFFEYSKYKMKHPKEGTSELIVSLRGKETTVHVDLHYQLSSSDYYIRKKINVYDTSNCGHLLRYIYPLYNTIESSFDIMKKGDFGQPVALTRGDGGGFFGLEYPGATNELVKTQSGKYQLQCGQEIGKKIDTAGLESAWCVQAIVPQEYVKNWFMKYLDDIRVSKVEPYTLYNSWYDLRSAEYPNVPKENVMNEENSLRIINLIQTTMIQNHDIKIDAFVLDDGWDVYKSDWVLRPQQFPNGFTPLDSTLKKTHTTLGIWFGLTGGYSFRMDRIQCMKDSGYETIGKGKDFEMLCIAGNKYSALFEKRICDLIKDYKIGYYKWDGIQFACSEPSHGHPIDIYSRRAILDTILEKTRIVRGLNPNIYLNITSGTWLSPWWVKYANQIWMDGSDYGYADVPSISLRDGATTYRDMVLHEDFVEKDLWFPISNLMTHGIIKGKLNMLGGVEEPLDKFTDESMMYFARGVSMWELYVSPDTMSEGEYTAISQSMHWARDRFPILQQTFMVGNDPKKGEPYAYVHFKNNTGIISVRNPSIQRTELKINLDPALGFASKADSLVLERTYPTRWISPKLYSATDNFTLELDGYETAIYEVYPIRDAAGPLLSGIVFSEKMIGTNENELTVIAIKGKTKLLNTARTEKIMIADSSYVISDLSLPEWKSIEPVTKKKFDSDKNSNIFTLTADIDIDTSVVSGDVSVLFKPTKDYIDVPFPAIKFYLKDKEIVTRSNKEKGRWDWETIPVTRGNNQIKIVVTPNEKTKTWYGTAAFWFLGNQKQNKYTVNINSRSPINKRILPPTIFAPGESRRTIQLDELKIKMSD